MNYKSMNAMANSFSISKEVADSFAVTKAIADSFASTKVLTQSFAASQMLVESAKTVEMLQKSFAIPKWEPISQVVSLEGEEPMEEFDEKKIEEDEEE